MRILRYGIFVNDARRYDGSQNGVGIPILSLREFNRRKPGFNSEYWFRRTWEHGDSETSGRLCTYRSLPSGHRAVRDYSSDAHFGINENGHGGILASVLETKPHGCAQFIGGADGKTFNPRVFCEGDPSALFGLHFLELTFHDFLLLAHGTPLSASKACGDNNDDSGKPFAKISPKIRAVSLLFFSLFLICLSFKMLSKSKDSSCYICVLLLPMSPIIGAVAFFIFLYAIGDPVPELF